jgi:hypothetical protein
MNNKSYYVELFVIYKTVHDSALTTMIKEKIFKKSDEGKNS